MIERVRQAIRRFIRSLAKPLNTLTGGKVSPNAITIIGFAMHAPIACLIAVGSNVWAAVLLVFFGLFDTLDGELARLQKRDSPAGMLLDASTDRLKEVLLYSGAAYALATGPHPATAAWAVAACGASMSVSYIKAKGEAAVASSKQKYQHGELNHLFADGLMRFEIRMVVLIAGLLVDQLMYAVILIALLSAVTAIKRLAYITRALS